MSMKNYTSTYLLIHTTDINKTILAPLPPPHPHGLRSGLGIHCGLGYLRVLWVWPLWYAGIWVWVRPVTTSTATYLRALSWLRVYAVQVSQLLLC